MITVYENTGSEARSGYNIFASWGLHLPCVPFITSYVVLALVAFLTFSSISGVAYCNAERDRGTTIQRAHAELEKILSTEEFRVREPQPPWWAKWIERLLRYLPGGTGWIGALLEWLVYLIAIAGSVFLFLFIARRFRRSPSFTIKSRDIPVRSGHDMDPEAARAQAYEYSQKGEYRLAIRHLYLSLLLYLDKAGLLTYDAGKTNGEYVGEARSSMRDRVEHFAFLTALFERKWYGMEESSAGEFQQFTETFAELVDS